MEVDNCTPNCAQGHDTPDAATVTLTRLVPYGNGYQAYAAMAISVPGASFLSERFSTGLVPLLRACLILITDVMPQRR